MKLVIPAAGFGTRFLPASKTVPKELLPVIDKPIIQYVVEEAVLAGIKDIIFVTGFNKRAIEDHFDISPLLFNHLLKFEKRSLFKLVKSISSLGNFSFISQKEFYGTGYSVLAAKSVVGNDKFFAVAWGDEFFLASPPVFAQLSKVYEERNASVILAMPVDNEGTRRVGIIEGEKIGDDLIRINKILEKPGPVKTKSRLASLGNYIISSEIFAILENNKRTLKRGQELYFSEALSDLAQKRPVYAKIVRAEYFDCGIPLAWLKSNVLMGLRRLDYKKDLTKFLKELKFK